MIKDGCRSQADEYRRARSAFDYEKTELDSALDDIDSSLRSVSSSCEFSFGSTARGGQSGGESPCRILLRYKGRMPAEKLVEMCTKAGRSAEQCQACIQ
jgi:hypothetical protein